MANAMTDKERARHAVARVFNRHPEAPTALRDWCAVVMEQEFAAVREETQADWRREKQVLVNRCTALEEQVTAVRREERERWESIIELYDTALEGACTLAENSMHLDGFEEPMADIRNAARQDLQRARAAIREQSDD